MNKLAHKIWLDYSELSWRMIGTLTWISYCDIHDDLKEKILADREAIEEKYKEKKKEYEDQIYN